MIPNRRVEIMRKIRYVLALAIMMSMIGWAFAAANTISMPGGTTSGTTGGAGGAATFGGATAFYESGANDASSNYIEADILAAAEVDAGPNANGASATVVSTVPTLITHTIAPIAGNTYSATVGAQGTVTASVTGGSTDAQVAAASLVHSEAAIDNIANPQASRGDAYIISGLGANFIALPPAGYINANNFLINGPKGQFDASSSVTNGQAQYQAATSNAGVSSGASGSISGATSIVGNVHASGATLSDFTASETVLQNPLANTYDTATIDPSMIGVFSQALPNAMGDVIGWVGANYPPPNRGPTSALMVYSVGSAAGTDAGAVNGVFVGATNQVNSGKSIAAGTASGTDSASASYTTVAPINSQTASVNEKATQSADVQVINQFDSADAVALEGTAAASGPGLSNDAVGSLAQNFADANRVIPGTASDGSDRTWGEAFTTGGNWNANAESTQFVAPVYKDDKATLSGSLASMTNPPANGMGAGAFLEASKTGPAYANVGVMQYATDEPIVATVGHDQPYTFIGGLNEIMGPKASSLGSNGWDAAGVYGDFNNLQVSATNTLATHSLIPSVSVTVSNINAYKWVDGTNDAAFNGPGFTYSGVTLTPVSTGLSGPFMTYLPSPTQRQSVHAIVAQDAIPTP